MNKLFYIKNPEIFQGQRKNVLKKNYFEGWYFKSSNNGTSISFIPGIHVGTNGQKAFLQIITNSNSYYVDYKIEDFTYSNEPFSIQLGKNFFFKEKIVLEILEEAQNLELIGELDVSNYSPIQANFFSPNIMGPFSYLPFMECNHAILSMSHKVNGQLQINKKLMSFKDGTGYIEKDFGISFPKSYIWVQGNCFQKQEASFMLSIADVPLKAFTFQGVICVLIFEGKEYKFTTYNGAKLKKFQINNSSVEIHLKRGSYTLELESSSLDGLTLVAPVKGNMEKKIKESIASHIKVTLKKSEKVLFSDRSTDCGIELVE